MKKKFLLISIVLFLILPSATFCFQGVSEAQSTAMKVKIGQKAPDFTLKTIDGDEITLSDYFGKKVVMLEFWATWCDICKKMIPHLIKTYDRFREKGFELLGVTLQSGEDEAIRKTIEKFNINYPILIDENLKVATKIYGLAGPIPLNVIIGCGGKVRYSHVGDYPPGEYEIPYVVEDLLQEPECSN